MTDPLKMHLRREDGWLYLSLWAECESMLCLTYWWVKLVCLKRCVPRQRRLYESHTAVLRFWGRIPNTERCVSDGVKRGQTWCILRVPQALVYTVLSWKEYVSRCAKLAFLVWRNRDTHLNHSSDLPSDTLAGIIVNLSDPQRSIGTRWCVHISCTAAYYRLKCLTLCINPLQFCTRMSFEDSNSK